MMLIVALVLAVIGLAALVTAVVTSNELIAWVCIGASVIGVILLIVDALQERNRSAGGADSDAESHDAESHDDETTTIPAVTDSRLAEDYPEEPTGDAEVLSPDVAQRQQADHPSDDDLPPAVKHD